LADVLEMQEEKKKSRGKCAYLHDLDAEIADFMRHA
jgi:hypothetical protein